MQSAEEAAGRSGSERDGRTASLVSVRCITPPPHLLTSRAPLLALRAARTSLSSHAAPLRMQPITSVMLCCSSYGTADTAARTCGYAAPRTLQSAGVAAQAASPPRSRHDAQSTLKLQVQYNFYEVKVQLKLEVKGRVQNTYYSCVVAPICSSTARR